MAILEASVYSVSLMRTVSVNIILPSDKTDAAGRLISKPPYRTLYLLHGMLGNHTDWLVQTMVHRYAMDHDLAVIMPSGENRFYVDQAPDQNYGNFISNELPTLMKAMFPLSDQAEDTAIAGLSMGGFGALINGLSHPETFGRIGAFSAALFGERLRDLREKESLTPGELYEMKSYETVLGEPFHDALQADRDVLLQAKENVKNHQSLPEVFISCGTEDDLFSLDQTMAETLKDLGYSVVFKEYPGAHEWNVWDASIKDFIDWMCPAASEGISSGNVVLNQN